MQACKRSWRRSAPLTIRPVVERAPKPAGLIDTTETHTVAVREAMEALGVKHQNSLRHLRMNFPDFPKPVSRGQPKGVGGPPMHYYSADELLEWIEQHPRKGVGYHW